MLFLKFKPQPDRSSFLPLTARQRSVFDAICTYVRTFNTVPSLREISVSMNQRSINGIRCHVQALERKGFLRRRENMTRSLLILDDEANLKNTFFVYGHIHNCRLREAENCPKVDLGVDSLFWKRNSFVVIAGDSSLKSEYGIVRGDYIILSQTRSLQSGDIALVVDESREVYLVMYKLEEDGNACFISMDETEQRIKIANPTVLGTAQVLMRFWRHLEIRNEFKEN